MAGCSIDTLEDQQAFAKKLDLRYPLIADPDGEIVRAYDVMHPEYEGVAARATVIIGEDGTVLKTYPQVDMRAGGHAGQVFEDLKALVG